VSLGCDSIGVGHGKTLEHHAISLRPQGEVSSDGADDKPSRKKGERSVRIPGQ